MGETSDTAQLSLDSAYVIADALGYPVPSVSEVTGISADPAIFTEPRQDENITLCTEHDEWKDRLLLLLSKPHLPLNFFSNETRTNLNLNKAPNTNIDARICNEFIQHFAACVISLARRAALAARNSKGKSSLFSMESKTLGLTSVDDGGEASSQEGSDSDDDGDKDKNITIDLENNRKPNAKEQMPNRQVIINV